MSEVVAPKPALRPGKRRSMVRLNSASIEIRSSKVPCSGQVLRTRISLSCS
jgi:hypothetical protein